MRIVTRLRILLHHTALSHFLDCLRGDHDTILVTARPGSAFSFGRRCRWCLRWTPDDRLWQIPRGRV